jgi:NADH-quinone oxidoreductase subunit N
MLNSAIGLYYYLRVTVAMYFESASAESADRREPNVLRVGVIVAAVFTVLIGIFPGLWVGIFQTSLGG